MAQLHRCRKIIGNKASITLVIVALAWFSKPTFARSEDDVDILDFLPAILAGHQRMGVKNGWYVRGNKIVWGYAQHNGWWRAGRRANITRNAGSLIRPNKTEDLDALIDNMLRWSYPGFEHNYGLWYDRRRDRHDTACRSNASVQGPFLEQPWARSQSGRACDGLPRYDLTRYNQWYFNRLGEFSKLSNQKGVIFFNNFYMQHALLEQKAHYVDFPWRPGNAIQSTGMPNTTPAANVFYDTSNSTRRSLHTAYINKVLDETGKYPNVVQLLSEEYTGSRSFMNFWIDTLIQWERENNRPLHIGLGATKDVLDGVLADANRSAAIDTIDLRYWWYKANGKIFAPAGGRQIAGRFAIGGDAAEQTSPQQLYRQVKEYRLRYPQKAIIHAVEASRQQSWAFLMGGGSMLLRKMEYPGGQDPPSYISPADSAILNPTYQFIRSKLAVDLANSKPMNLIPDNPDQNWCLADPGNLYLIYALHGGTFRVNLASAPISLTTKWFNPSTGSIINTGNTMGGGIVEFTAPNGNDWALWLAPE